MLATGGGGGVGELNLGSPPMENREVPLSNKALGRCFLTVTISCGQSDEVNFIFHVMI